jgi:Cytochrome domain of cellobiose dehydrogenase
MVAPSGTEWLGLGQGTQMAGANMLIMYASGSNNVTVSPRLGEGQFEPQFNSDAQITVLEGSGIDSHGNLIANIRCDTCLSWSGGSMDPTDSSSSWMWAIKSGSPLDSTSTSATITQHDTESLFGLNLQQGTGGSSSNPFIQTSSSGTSASASGTASSVATGTSASTPSPTVVVTGPAATSGSSSGSFSIPVNSTRATHAAVMSVVFILFFPLFALTLYLPTAKRVRYVHAPLQVFSIILLLVGLGTGVKLGKSIEILDGYHQVIGYIVVAVMIGFQPALGIYQHLYYHKTGGRSALGVFHQWLGRTVIVVGIVNGGLGFMQSGPVGSTYVPRYAVVLYSIVALAVLFVYLAVVVISKRRAGNDLAAHEKISGRTGYEMHPPSNDEYVQFRQGNRGYQNSTDSRPNHGARPSYR